MTKKSHHEQPGAQPPVTPSAELDPAVRHEQLVRVECIKAAIEIRLSMSTPTMIITNAEQFEAWVQGRPLAEAAAPEDRGSGEAESASETAEPAERGRLVGG